MVAHAGEAAWPRMSSLGVLRIPDVVRDKAAAFGAEAWLDELPEMVAEMANRWSLTIGRVFDGGTESLVAEATREDGTAAVLKVAVPGRFDAVRHEITALRLADGTGLARLLRADEDHCVLLLERLGQPLQDLALPIVERQEILCATAQHVWRPAAGHDLPTGADKARWLSRSIQSSWEETGRPCSRRAVDHAQSCARRRMKAHDDRRAVLVHGDVHQWNALQAPDGGFKLVDPDGLLAEPEYDLGIIMREDPAELLDGDPYARATSLAARTGLDPVAIWEWGVVERVSTGLLTERIGLQPAGRQMLAAADQFAAWT